MSDRADGRRKVDRDEVFVEYTKSICPLCKVVVDAQVNVRDDRVFLRKRCREHGTFEALRSSDAGLYFDSLRFNKAGTIPLETQTETRLPSGLRAVSRSQAACLPGDHRGEHRLQPRLPHLFRRLGTSTRRLLAHPGAGRLSPRRLLAGRGRTGGGDVLGG